MGLWTGPLHSALLWWPTLVAARATQALKAACLIHARTLFERALVESPPTRKQFQNGLKLRYCRLGDHTDAKREDGAECEL